MPNSPAAGASMAIMRGLERLRAASRAASRNSGAKKMIFGSQSSKMNVTSWVVSRVEIGTISPPASITPAIASTSSAELGR